MKRLYRSQKNKIIAGVCGGIAEYFNVDPVLVRIIFVLLFFTGGSALLAYIVGWIIIPVQAEREATQSEKETAAKVIPAAEKGGLDASSTFALVIGIVLVVLGTIFFLRNIPWFGHYYWWFWRHVWKFFWAAVLIILGLAMIIRGAKK